MGGSMSMQIYKDQQTSRKSVHRTASLVTNSRIPLLTLHLVTVARSTGKLLTAKQL
jgi:hypothetical protein